MTVAHLHRAGTQRQRQHLVAKADPEDGQVAVQQVLDHRHRVFAGRGRVARAVRQEHALGVVGHHFGGCGGGGQDRHVGARRHQRAQDVALGAIIQRHDLERARGPGRGLEPVGPGPQPLVPAIALPAAHVTGKVEAHEPRPSPCPLDHRGGVEAAFGIVGQHHVRRPLLADRAGQAAGVDAADADPAAPLHPVCQVRGRAPVRRLGRVPLDDDARRHRVRRLVIQRGHAGVADVGKGEGHDLRGVRGIGHDLLIAGHRGVEDKLCHHLARRAEAVAAEDRSVGKRKAGGRCRHVMSPANRRETRRGGRARQAGRRVGGRARTMPLDPGCALRD